MKKKAFTLVELLVVIAIIAVLVSILIPALGKAKMQARLVLCANNQHQILLGLKQYQADYEMKLPPTIQGMYYNGEYWEPPYYITHYADPVHPRYAIRMGGGSIGLQLGRYLPDANIFQCPASPLDTNTIMGRDGETYQEIYRTGIGQSRMFTNYWLFWNYGGWSEKCRWSGQLVEFKPFDGGKSARASGVYAILVAHENKRTMVQLPSGKMKWVSSKCRATIGVVSGGGRIEKPLLKAGKKYNMMKSKAGKYPRVSGVAMNSIDHPFGGGGHQHPGKPKTVSRGAPPGRKVGSIAARRTGKR